MELRKLQHSSVLAALLFLFSNLLYAQTKTVSGHITDAAGVGLPGATVTVKGTQVTAVTDAQGRFTVTVPASAKTLSITTVGYNPQEIDLGNLTQVDVRMQTATASLNEVVVVGYGTRRKKDLTGSVATVTAEDFQKGVITTPEQLIAGKVAGVQITSNGGAPGAGSRIRIRSGSSLNASNEPLIVIDGVPLENSRNSDNTSKVSGVSDPLALINPNDIESFNILKDASAAAIYGSRAANGVVIITTKKGASGKLRINFSTNESVSNITDQVDVLSTNEYRELIKTHGTAAQIGLLGNASTNWQDEIYRTSFTTDNNLSLSGGVQGLPYRLSLGYLNQSGILLTDKLTRGSAALNLTPKFFDNHLSVDLNLKGSIAKSHFADQDAIGTAIFFDPTHPVRSDSAIHQKYGGYWEWLNTDGSPNTNAPRNPVSMLEQRDDEGKVKRSIGNIQLDYKMHFLPELRANLNLGYDASQTDGTKVYPPTLASVYTKGGTKTQYSQERWSKLLEFYLNYARDLKNINSRLDATAGYSYQDWLTETPAYPTFYGVGTQEAAGNPSKTQNTLISYFGRLNYTLADKYLLTATVRRDGSSRFNENNRWGTFPSVALAWRIMQEPFMKTSHTFSDLKLRVGYGVTGQQDILGGDYPYFARYSISDSAASYLLGNSYYFPLRPAEYDENIKWEETETWNAGVDLGFLQGRLSGSIDYYFKKTKDLLAVVPVPAGSNFSNRVLTNVGNIENHGIEFMINAVPVRTSDFSWDLNFNFTWNHSKITNLSKIKDTVSQGIEVGGIGGGVGNNIQIHTVGYNPYSFYVYKQVYDQNGKPLEGIYVDLNKDGIINQNDKYRYKRPDPNYLLGFTSQFGYKNWNASFTMRANFGNYAYNNFRASNGTYANFRYPNYLGNISTNVLETNWEGVDSRRLWSDYFIENASFLRMDNFNLGYDFGKIQNLFSLRLSATVQNVFTITNYTGLDPELASGIDNKFYPRPRVFTIGANLNF